MAQRGYDATVASRWSDIAGSVWYKRLCPCGVVSMMRRRKLPLIVLGRRMIGDAPTNAGPKIIFELEAETGEIFEVGFSLRGILSTVVMANNWRPLQEELAQL